MHNKVKEHKALITRLIADLKILHYITVYHIIKYEICDGELDTAVRLIKMGKNPKHAFHYVLKIYAVSSKLRKSGISEDDRKAKLKETIIENMNRWLNERPDDTQIDEGIIWWVDVTCRLGFGEIWESALISLWNDKNNGKKNYEAFKNNVSKLKAEGILPAGLRTVYDKEHPDNTAEEYAALLFNLPKLIKLDGQHIPPGNDIWLSLGVNSASEYKAKSPILETFKLATNTEYFNQIMRATLTTAKRANEQKDAKDAGGEDINVDKVKLERMVADSKNPKKKRKYGIKAQLEDSGVIHRGYAYKDDDGDVVVNVIDRNQVDTDEDSDRAEERLRRIQQFNTRELALLNDEYERLNAKPKKSRKEYYGEDKGLKVTQRIKYLKTKYLKR